MGAEPWAYFVDYDSNIQEAVDRLREREFRAGRFRYSEEGPTSIAEAIEIADADGTASILDIETVATEPDFGAVAPFSDDELLAFFGTTKPSHSQIEANFDFFEGIERGQGRYVIAYADGKPSEIFFAGYSYD